MDHRRDTYLGGRWVAAHGQQIITVIDPSSEECVATVRESSEDDVDHAVAAAAAAAPGLAATDPAERARLLERLAAQLESRADLLAEAVSREMGMPLKLCPDHQVRPAVDVVRAVAASLPDVVVRQRIPHGVHVLEPIGVVAALTAWNYPLAQIAGTLAPALAAGCPVVLKPSELAPLDALLLAEAVDAAGWPDGAFNLVLGTGPDVGEALVRHPLVSMVSFTGSVRTGRRVTRLAAGSVERLRIDIGGKSPCLVLDDADLRAAVHSCVRTVMLNSGQARTALSRLLVPFQSIGSVEYLVAEAMQDYRLGPAADPASDVGPLGNANQLHRVNEHLERAPLDGARTIWSHPRADLPDKGFFVAPTAFAVTDPEIALAREDVFGPVLTVIPYLDEDHAVAIANATNCGPVAAVWSADEEHAVTVAERIRARTVDVNGSAPATPAPPAHPTDDLGLAELGPGGSSHPLDGFARHRSIRLPRRQAR